jgi:hypothetical protein
LNNHRGFGSKIKGLAGGAAMGMLAKKIMGGKSHKSGYGSHNHNYQSGLYNGYNYRPGDYNQVRGSVCTNYLEYDGIVYGQFICPIEGFELDETACCGLPREQFCCRPGSQQQQQNIDNSFNNDYNRVDKPKRSGGFLAIIIILLLFSLLILFCVALFCCFKKKIYEKVSTRSN